MVKNILITIIVFILFSCERELKSPIPYLGDKLVVFAFLQTGKTVEVSIDYSYDLNEDVTKKTIDQNLKIQLFENNKLVDDLIKIENGKYKGNYLVKLENKYYLKITSKEYGDIISETIEPLKPITNLDFKIEKNVNGSLNKSNKAVNISVFFNDTESDNYNYVIDFVGYSSGKLVNLTKLPFNINTQGSDLCNNLLADYTLIKTGTCLNSNSNKTTFNVELNVYDLILRKTKTVDSIAVNVQKVTPLYSDYLKTYDDSNFLENAFKNTVIFKSNFNNAIGIFYPKYQIRKIYYDLKDY